MEEFYSTPDSEGKRRNRSKKYEGVSMRPQDIARKVQELERASVGDEAAFESWNEQLRKSTSDVNSYTRSLDNAERKLRDNTEEYNRAADSVAALSAAFEAGKPEKL